jgi:hypothetical protein
VVSRKLAKGRAGPTGKKENEQAVLKDTLLYGDSGLRQWRVGTVLPSHRPGLQVPPELKVAATLPRKAGCGQTGLAWLAGPSTYACRGIPYGGLVGAAPGPGIGPGKPYEAGTAPA